jgi:hypothetical protein
MALFLRTCWAVLRNGEPIARVDQPTADSTLPGDYTPKNEVPAANPQAGPVASSVRRLLEHRRPLLEFAFDEHCQRGRGASVGAWDDAAKVEQALADIFVVQRLGYGGVQRGDDRCRRPFRREDRVPGLRLELRQPAFDRGRNVRQRRIALGRRDAIGPPNALARAAPAQAHLGFTSNELRPEVHETSGRSGAMTQLKKS